MDLLKVRGRGFIPALALGLGFVLLSALAYPRLLRALSATELVAPSLPLHAHGSHPIEQVPTSVDGIPFHEISSSPDGLPELSPGLHAFRWEQHFRGGHKRSITQVQQFGPLQNSSAPPCGAHLLISPDFLAPLSEVLSAAVHAELDGTSYWPVGEFHKISKVKLNWVRHTEETTSANVDILWNVFEPVEGHLALSLVLHFEEARIPVRAKLLPVLRDQELSIHAAVHAQLNMKGLVYRMLSSLFGGDGRASRLIAKELKVPLRSLLSTPPPIPLGNDRFVELSFCRDRQLRFHEAGHVSVPLAIELPTRTAERPALHTSSPDPASTAMTAPLAVELDINALNALSYVLWDSGILDEALATQVVPSFHDNPLVQEFLSLRIRDMVLPLPPSISMLPNARVQLRSWSRLLLVDEDKQTPAGLFAELEVPVFALSPHLPAVEDRVHISALDMSCESKRGPSPCYQSILGQLVANAESVEKAATESFRRTLQSLLSERAFDARFREYELLLRESRLRALPHGIRAELSSQITKINKE